MKLSNPTKYQNLTNLQDGKSNRHLITYSKKNQEGCSKPVHETSTNQWSQIMGCKPTQPNIFSDSEESFQLDESSKKSFKKSKEEFEESPPLITVSSQKESDRSREDGKATSLSQNHSQKSVEDGSDDVSKMKVYDQDDSPSSSMSKRSKKCKRPRKSNEEKRMKEQKEWKQERVVSILFGSGSEENQRRRNEEFEEFENMITNKSETDQADDVEEMKQTSRSLRSTKRSSSTSSRQKRRVLVENFSPPPAPSTPAAATPCKKICKKVSKKKVKPPPRRDTSITPTGEYVGKKRERKNSGFKTPANSNVTIRRKHRSTFFLGIDDKQFDDSNMDGQATQDVTTASTECATSMLFGGPNLGALPGNRSQRPTAVIQSTPIANRCRQGMEHNENLLFNNDMSPLKCDESGPPRCKLARYSNSSQRPTAVIQSTPITNHHRHRMEYDEDPLFNNDMSPLKCPTLLMLTHTPSSSTRPQRKSRLTSCKYTDEGKVIIDLDPTLRGGDGGDDDDGDEKHRWQFFSPPSTVSALVEVRRPPSTEHVSPPSTVSALVEVRRPPSTEHVDPSEIRDHNTQDQVISSKIIYTNASLLALEGPCVGDTLASESEFSGFSEVPALECPPEVNIVVLQQKKKKPMNDTDKLLFECNQNKIQLFGEVLQDYNKVTKLGEGVYSEVFCCKNTNIVFAVKVMPIEGEKKINGTDQKRCKEVLSEIVISRELTELAKQLSSGKDNWTYFFIETKKISLIQGKYPKMLLDAWDAFDKENSERPEDQKNDRPSELYDSEQRHIMFTYEFGGEDLENYEFDDARQGFCLLHQIVSGLAVAELRLKFEHRDLHWGNILVNDDNVPKEFVYKFKGSEYKIKSLGVIARIIDFTFSRISHQDSDTAGEETPMYFDLASDPDLFVGDEKKDYQFEIYRKMRDQLGNCWKNSDLKTNIFWIDYLLEKLVNQVLYKKCNKKKKRHLAFIRKMKKLRKTVNDYSSAADLLQDYFHDNDPYDIAS